LIFEIRGEEFAILQSPVAEAYFFELRIGNGLEEKRDLITARYNLGLIISDISTIRQKSVIQRKGYI
jgi:hypothetical protein